MPLGFTTVSATQLVDSTGVPLANGIIYFQPVLSDGTPASCIINGLVPSAAVGSASDQPVSANIVNGAFTINLPDVSVTEPQWMAYAVQVKDTDKSRIVYKLGYETFQPQGASVAFDKVPPNVPKQASIQRGPPGQDGAPGSITSPVPNQVTFQQGFTANGMAVGAGDPALQTYAVSLAGSNGIEFAGIDPAGGLHWEAALSSTGTMTAPEFDLGIPGASPAVTTTLVDPSSLNNPHTRIVLSGPNGLSFATIDDAGNITLSNGLKVGGSFAFAGIFAAPAQTGAVVDADGWNYFTAPDTNGKLQIFQNFGTLTNQLTFGTANSWAPQLSADGTYLCFMSDRVTAGSAASVNAYRMNLGGSEQVPLSFNPELSLQQDISILAIAGQSLAGGAASGAPVTTTPYGHNVMLQGGAMQTGSYGNGAPTSLVPLIEMNLSGSGDETPCSSMSNQFAYLCQLYKGLLPTIGSQSSAAGGHTLAALFDPTQGWYPHMTAAFPFFTSLSAAIGRKAYPRAIGFVHGESDGNTPSAGGNLNYGPQLLAYYLKWIQDIGTASGTFTAPPLFLTQTSSEYAYSSHAQNVMSPQQLAACLNNPGRFYFAGPEYAMQQSYDTQNVHLSAKGYQWLGQQIATAMFRALVLKQRRTGLMPKLAQKVGSSIFIPFWVPRPLGVSAAPALTFDTVNIPAITSGGIYQGFEVRTSAGTLSPVTNDANVNDAEGNPTIVRVDCQGDPGTGGTVGYANTYVAISGASTVGPSGNLRTLWGGPALYPTIQFDATHGDLFDWCAHFKIPYAS